MKKAKWGKRFRHFEFYILHSSIFIAVGLPLTLSLSPEIRPLITRVLRGGEGTKRDHYCAAPPGVETPGNSTSTLRVADGTPHRQFQDGAPVHRRTTPIALGSGTCHPRRTSPASASRSAGNFQLFVLRSTGNSQCHTELTFLRRRRAGPCRRSPCLRRRLRSGSLRRGHSRSGEGGPGRVRNTCAAGR